jgi:hypothetical protein
MLPEETADLISDSGKIRRFQTITCSRPRAAKLEIFSAFHYTIFPAKAQRSRAARRLTPGAASTLPGLS